MHGVCSISRLQLVDVVVILGDLPKTCDFTSCSTKLVYIGRKRLNVLLHIGNVLFSLNTQVGLVPCRYSGESTLVIFQTDFANKMIP